MPSIAIPTPIANNNLGIQASPTMNNQDKPSAKLDGFAPATGSGVSGSSHPASASASVASAGGTSPAAHAAAAPSAKKPAASSVAAASTETKRTKKRAPKKTGGASAAGGASASTTTTNGQNDNDTVEKELRPLSEIGSGFEPITLPQLQLRLKKLLDKLPKDKPEIPNNYDASAPDSQAAVYAPIKSFASTVQIAIEEYNLLLSLVSSATYRWGVDRSGASQQNLSVMSAELQTCQEVISNVVSARLSNVLCPAVDVLIGEVEIVRAEESDDDNGGGEADGKAAAPTPAKKRKLNEDRLSTTSTKATNNERRINHYTRPLVDPSYVHLCHCILARNAPLILHSVATSIHTAQRVIGDYLNAMKKDTSHEASKGGYY